MTADKATATAEAGGEYSKPNFEETETRRAEESETSGSRFRA